jgi:hypothetical protein
MKRERSAKEKIGTALQWIGGAGCLLCLAGILVTDFLLLSEPSAPQSSTQNVIRWDYKGYVHYITPTEAYWGQYIHMWWPFALMFLLACLGVYLTPNENEKWLKIFKLKS